MTTPGRHIDGAAIACTSSRAPSSSLHRFHINSGGTGAIRPILVFNVIALAPSVDAPSGALTTPSLR